MRSVFSLIIYTINACKYVRTVGVFWEIFHYPILDHIYVTNCNLASSWLLSLFCLVSLQCIAINVSVQYNGGVLSDMILLTQCY